MYPSSSGAWDFSRSHCIHGHKIPRNLHMQESSFSKRLAALLAILALSVLILLSTLGGRPVTQPVNILHAQSVRAPSFSYPHNTLFPSPPQISISHQMPPEPNVNAQSFLVQLIGDETPLLQRRASKEMHPASLTKILTSLVAIENLDSQTPLVFSTFAKAAGEKESLVPAGETFALNDVIRFAVIESANDAAVALAEAIGRKRGAFSFDDAMALFKETANQKVKTIGMSRTHFENPTGLDNDNHYTTAQDLFRLVSYVWENYPEIWDFSRSSEANLQSLSGHVYHIAATNQLISEFPALRGGKTGLTDQAKGTLILLYPVKPDRTAVIIILGSDDRFNDGRLLINWLEQAFNSL